jgi:hypothetical protein
LKIENFRTTCVQSSSENKDNIYLKINEYQQYIVLFQDFHNIALDELTLEVEIRYRNDFLAQPNDDHYNRCHHHAAYRHEYQPSLPPTNPTYCPVWTGFMSHIYANQNSWGLHDGSLLPSSRQSMKYGGRQHGDGTYCSDHHWGVPGSHHIFLLI